MLLEIVDYNLKHRVPMGNQQFLGTVRILRYDNHNLWSFTITKLTEYEIMGVLHMGLEISVGDSGSRTVIISSNCLTF